MRCRHEEVTVSERATYGVNVSFVRGVAVSSWDDPPWPTGTGTVKCEVCGMKRRYGMSRRRLPRWVREAVDAFEAGEPSEGGAE